MDLIIVRNLFIVSFFGVALCQQLEPPREEFTRIYAQFHDTKNFPKDTDYRHQLMDRARDLVRQAISHALQISPDPKLEEIQTAIGDVQGGNDCMVPTFSHLKKPFAYRSAVNGVPVIVTAFAVCGSMMENQLIMDFWVRYQGTWERRAQAGREFKSNVLVDIWPVPSGMDSQIWFLVQGRVIAADQGQSQLRLYSFDGNTVQQLGDMVQLSVSRVDLKNQSVLVDYIDTGNARPNLKKQFRATIYGLQPIQ